MLCRVGTVHGQIIAKSGKVDQVKVKGLATVVEIQEPPQII